MDLGFERTFSRRVGRHIHLVRHVRRQPERFYNVGQSTNLRLGRRSPQRRLFSVNVCARTSRPPQRNLAGEFRVSAS